MITRSRRAKRRNSRLLWPVLFLAGFLAAVSASPAPGRDVYFYRDSKGVMHFTNAPTDSRYRPFQVRARVKIGTSPRRVTPAALVPYIRAAAQKYQLDPALVMAVIRAESAFNARAVSWAGARGLMQLMPDTADLLGVTNSFDPQQNIFGGCRYLRLLLDRFNGDLALALAGYNIGPERVAKDKGIPDVSETKDYVRRVLRYYNEYKKQT